MQLLKLDSAMGVELGARRLVLSTLVKTLGGLKSGSTLVIENFRDLDAADLHDQVQEFIRSNGVNTDTVIVGISREQVAVRRVELPLEVEENLEQVVQFQVNKLEPSEEAVACFDYQVLERDEKAKNLAIQIVLLPRKVVDESVELLRNIGLQAARLAPSSVGLQQLARLRSKGDLRQAAIVIRCEEGEVEAVWIDPQGWQFSHLERDGTGDDRLESVCLTLDGLLSQIDSQEELQIDNILLTGSLDEELLDPVRDRFGSGELIRDLRVNLEGTAPSSLAVTGCALGLAATALGRTPASKLNLMPEELRSHRTQLSYFTTLALAGLLVVVLGLLGSRGYLQQSQLLASMSARADELKPQVAAILDSRQQLEQEQEKVKELREMFAGRQRVLLVLKELTELIPDDAYLQTLRIDTGEVTMTGFSDSSDTLIPILQESRCLKNVESKYITQDRRSGKDKFSFEAKVADCDLLSLE